MEARRGLSEERDRIFVQAMANAEVLDISAGKGCGFFPTNRPAARIRSSGRTRLPTPLRSWASATRVQKRSNSCLS